MMRIVSYNCNSFRNNFENIRSLLHDCDILLLQELMLEKRDLEILSDLHENFKYIAEVRDREMEGICEGRPSGGGVATVLGRCLLLFHFPQCMLMTLS